MIRSGAEAVGNGALVLVQTIGQLTLALGGSIRSLLKRNLPWREVIRQLDVCGARCLPVTTLASICVGCIVAVQGMDYVRRYSAPQAFGWGAYFSAVREVGPLLLGLTISARLGAWHAAEIAALRVTDRVDALRALAVDPWGVLVAPRLFAMPIASALLMAWADAVSLAAATSFAWAFGDVTPWTTWGSIADLGRWSDLLLGLWKAAAYGLFTGLTATGIGMAAKGGAEAVGQAVMRAAVASLLVITAVNHALTVGLSE